MIYKIRLPQTLIRPRPFWDWNGTSSSIQGVYSPRGVYGPSFLLKIRVSVSLWLSLGLFVRSDWREIKLCESNMGKENMKRYRKVSGSLHHILRVKLVKKPRSKRLLP